MTILGIDLGTSALKLVIVDEDQAVAAETAVPLSVSNPRRGWFEQEPGDWWAALQAAVAQMRSSQPGVMQDVRALGLSGQMHGAVLLDRAGQVIRPAIL